MNKLFFIFVIIFSRYAMGALEPVTFKGTVQIADTGYLFGGYPSFRLKESMNKILICEKDMIQEDELCVPVNVVIDNPTDCQQIIANLNPGLKKTVLTREFKQITRKPTIMVLPVSKLQTDCNLTAKIGKALIISCAIDGCKNRPKIEEILVELKGKEAAQIFAYEQETKLSMFKSEIESRILTLAIKELIQCSKGFMRLLKEKESHLTELLKEAKELKDAGKDNSDIMDQARAVNMMSIWNYSDGIAPICSKAFSFGKDNKAISVYLTSDDFYNGEIEECMRKVSLNSFCPKQPGNIFSIIQNQKAGLRNFNHPSK